MHKTASLNTRPPARLLQGSAFVEFASAEEAARVATLSLEYAGAPLALEPKLTYVARKAAERHAKPNSPANPANASKAPAVGTKRRAQGEPGEDAAEAEEGAAAEEEEAAAAAAPAAAVPDFERGCLVHFAYAEGVEFAEAPTFGLVKDSFGGRPGVSYVDYTLVSGQGGVQSGAVGTLAKRLLCS